MRIYSSCVLCSENRNNHRRNHLIIAPFQMLRHHTPNVGPQMTFAMETTPDRTFLSGRKA